MVRIMGTSTIHREYQVSVISLHKSNSGHSLLFDNLTRSRFLGIDVISGFFVKG